MKVKDLIPVLGSDVTCIVTERRGNSLFPDSLFEAGAHSNVWENYSDCTVNLVNVSPTGYKLIIEINVED